MFKLSESKTPGPYTVNEATGTSVDCIKQIFPTCKPDDNHDKEALVVTEIACALNAISNEFKHKNKITIGCEEVFALCEQRVEDLWFRIENTIITWGTDMYWLLRQHGYVVIVDYIPIEGCEQLGLCWRKIRVADTKSNFEMIFVDSTPVRKP